MSTYSHQKKKKPSFCLYLDTSKWCDCSLGHMQCKHVATTSLQQHIPLSSLPSPGQPSCLQSSAHDGTAASHHGAVGATGTPTPHLFLTIVKAPQVWEQPYSPTPKNPQGLMQTLRKSAGDDKHQFTTNLVPVGKSEGYSKQFISYHIPHMLTKLIFQEMMQWMCFGCASVTGV